MLASTATRRIVHLGRRAVVAPSSSAALRFYTTGGSFEHIIVSKPTVGVRLIQLNRPKALNALFTPLILELNKALESADADAEIGAIVVTGSERSFAGTFFFFFFCLSAHCGFAGLGKVG